MAFDFSKLGKMRHETFVVEVTEDQKRILDGVMYRMGLTREEYQQGKALWESIKQAWNEASVTAKAQDVLLTTYELKVKEDAVR